MYPEGAESTFHRTVGRVLPDNNNNKRTKVVISKLFRKYLSNVPKKHNARELQKIGVLNTVHTHRKC